MESRSWQVHVVTSPCPANTLGLAIAVVVCILTVCAQVSRDCILVALASSPWRDSEMLFLINALS